MKRHQAIYFGTFVFGSILASIFSAITGVSPLEVGTFLLISYTFYHLLEWKYQEEEEDV